MNVSGDHNDELLVIKDKIIKTAEVLQLLGTKNKEINKSKKKYEKLLLKYSEKNDEIEQLQLRLGDANLSLIQFNTIKENYLELKSKYDSLDKVHNNLINSAEIKYQNACLQLEELNSKYEKVTKELDIKNNESMENELKKSIILLKETEEFEKLKKKYDLIVEKHNKDLKLLTERKVELEKLKILNHDLQSDNSKIELEKRVETLEGELKSSKSKIEILNISHKQTVAEIEKCFESEIRSLKEQLTQFLSKSKENVSTQTDFEENVDEMLNVMTHIPTLLTPLSDDEQQQQPIVKVKSFGRFDKLNESENEVLRLQDNSDKLSELSRKIFKPKPRPRRRRIFEYRNRWIPIIRNKRLISLENLLSNTCSIVIGPPSILKSYFNGMNCQNKQIACNCNGIETKMKKKRNQALSNDEESVINNKVLELKKEKNFSSDESLINFSMNNKKKKQSRYKRIMYSSDEDDDETSSTKDLKLNNPEIQSEPLNMSLSPEILNLSDLRMDTPIIENSKSNNKKLKLNKPEQQSEPLNKSLSPEILNLSDLRNETSIIENSKSNSKKLKLNKPEIQLEPLNKSLSPDILNLNDLRNETSLIENSKSNSKKLKLNKPEIQLEPLNKSLSPEILNLSYLRNETSLIENSKSNSKKLKLNKPEIQSEPSNKSLSPEILNLRIETPIIEISKSNNKKLNKPEIHSEPLNKSLSPKKLNLSDLRTENSKTNKKFKLNKPEIQSEPLNKALSSKILNLIDLRTGTPIIEKSKIKLNKPEIQPEPINKPLAPEVLNLRDLRTETPIIENSTSNNKKLKLELFGSETETDSSVADSPIRKRPVQRKSYFTRSASSSPLNSSNKERQKRVSELNQNRKLAMEKLNRLVKDQSMEHIVFRKPERSKIPPACPKSPDIVENVIDHNPKIIPLEMTTQLDLETQQKFVSDIAKNDWNENLMSTVATSLSEQNSLLVARLIVDEVAKDYSQELDKTFTPPAPMMTVTQQKLLALLFQLEKNGLKNIYENFLQLAEQRLLSETKVENVHPLTRLYVAACKLKYDIEQVRLLCCNAAYYMGDLLLPLMFIVLTMWGDVLPTKDQSEGIHLAAVLVQVIRSKKCRLPGYNSMNLNNILTNYYSYERQEVTNEELMSRLVTVYSDNCSKLVFTSILILCKNVTNNWTSAQIKTHLIPLIVNNIKYNTKLNVVSSLFHLIQRLIDADQICTEFVDIRNWIRQFPKENNCQILCNMSTYVINEF